MSISICVNLTIESDEYWQYGGHESTKPVLAWIEIPTSKCESELMFKQEVLKILPQLVEDFIKDLKETNCIEEFKKAHGTLERYY